MGCMPDAERNSVIVNFAIAALLKYRQKGPSSERANNGDSSLGLFALVFVGARSRSYYFSRADTRRRPKGCESKPEISRRSSPLSRSCFIHRDGCKTRIKPPLPK